MRPLLTLALTLVACGGSGTTIPGDGGGDTGMNQSDGSPDSGFDVVTQNDGGDASSTFDPKSVSGLSLWLKGDKGVTADTSQNVSVWADQSGNANDAKENRAGVQPTLVASGIHGLPTIHFASTACAGATCFTGFQGNDLSIADSPTMRWGTGDFLIEVVSRYTNDPTSVTHDAFGALYISIYGPPTQATSGFGLYANVFQEPGDLATSSGIEAYVAGQPATVSSGNGYNNDMPHVFAMQRVGTTLTVRIDGAIVGTQTIASIDTGMSGGRLGGCENAQAQRLEGDISEVIAVKGTIAAGDLTGIEGYLKGRYATP